MLESGIVKRFNSEGQYGFFFLVDANGNTTQQEVYFHFNKYRVPTPDNDAIAFYKPVRYRPSLPKPGDRVVFVRVRGEKGYRARYWTFASTWRRVQREHKLMHAHLLISPPEVPSQESTVDA